MYVGICFKLIFFYVCSISASLWASTSLAVNPCLIAFRGALLQCISFWAPPDWNITVCFLMDLWMATALKTVPDSISRHSPCWLDSWGCRWRIVAKQLRFLAPSQQLPPPLLWRLLLACWAWSRFSEGKKKAPLKPNHFGYVYGTGSQTAAVVQLWDG